MDLTQYHRADFQNFVQDHLKEDPALLLLKFQGKTDFDLKAAVQQIAARQKAAKKLPAWTADPRLIFPASISLEQSSSEDTARFKASTLQGKRMIDLTGGFGVDSYYLSEGFERAIYCEQQSELTELVAHNFRLLAPDKFKIIHGDGMEYLNASDDFFDLIYIDPARRRKGNQKMYKLEDCEPDVLSYWERMKSKASAILIKVSPMLDISQALLELPDIRKVQVLSVKNEVKELLLHWNQEAVYEQVQIEAIDLGSRTSKFLFSLEDEFSAKSTLGEVERYLIEPLAGILKAGGFKHFGEKFKLKKLSENSHLYTSSVIHEDLPARVFEVVQELSPKRAIIKKLFPSGKVNVITRNYATGATELKKKLGVKDGGTEFLIGTKTGSGYKLFWCKPHK